VKKLPINITKPKIAINLYKLSVGIFPSNILFNIIIDELKKLGIKGTLLNHSEKKLPFSILTKTVEYCKKKQFPVILCTSSLTEVKKMITLKPEYLAFEPPELIGGKISVSKAKPLSIIKTVQVVKKINPQTQVLCGAGIQNRDDLQKALQLGAQGVLLSHALIKTKKPEKVLEMMLS